MKVDLVNDISISKNEARILINGRFGLGAVEEIKTMTLPNGFFFEAPRHWPDGGFLFFDETLNALDEEFYHPIASRVSHHDKIYIPYQKIDDNETVVLGKIFPYVVNFSFELHDSSKVYVDSKSFYLIRNWMNFDEFIYHYTYLKQYIND